MSNIDTSDEEDRVISEEEISMECESDDFNEPGDIDLDLEVRPYRFEPDDDSNNSDNSDHDEDVNREDLAQWYV